MNLYEAIGVRHSVRKYSNKEVSEKLREQLLAFAGKASPLNDRIAVAFEMIDNREKKADIKGLWKVDAPWYLALYSEPAEGFERNGGYLMEQIVLYMTTKGLGTCYLGGSTVKKKRTDGKRLVMIIAFGYPEGKLCRESSLAKRLPLSELCVFKEEVRETMKTVLKAARLAPSAFNSQPWRFIVYSDRIYVFSKKETGLFRGLKGLAPQAGTGRDFSIGVMLSHIMLAAEELWLELETATEEQSASKVYKNGTYVATLTIRP